MPVWNLDRIGKAQIEKGKLKCDFAISSGEFFDKFKKLAAYLSADARNMISQCIDMVGNEVRLRKSEEEITSFFNNVQNQLRSSGAQGRGTSETTRTQSAEEGNKIPIKIIETIVAKYPYNYGVAEEKEGKTPEQLGEGYGVITRDGKIEITNVSSDQKIWDIKGKFENNGSIEKLDEELSIKELAPNETKTIEYALKAEKEPSIKVEEFISTMNDPNTLSYSLNNDQENIVYFKVSVKNTEQYAIKNVTIKKTLFESAGNVDIKQTSTGNCTQEDKNLVWKIEEISPNITETMEFSMAITISSKDQKVRSGPIEVNYDAAASLSDLKINEFEAYGDNEYYTEDNQMEDNPDLYSSTLIFNNLSAYQSKLKQASVKLQNQDKELLQVPSEKIVLGPKDKYTFNQWEIETQGEIPAYHKEVSFTLLSELTSLTSSVLTIEDLELSVAIFEAGLKYDVTQIPSYREVPFNTHHTLSNPGVTTFDYLSIKHVIPPRFKSPKKEEIQVKIDEQACPIDLAKISFKPDNEDPEVSHELFIEFMDMRNNEMEGLKASQNMTVDYPLTALSLSPEDKLITNAEWRANTYPLGKPIIITEVGDAATAIPVVHERIKVVRGKRILATSDQNVYDVVLTIKNNSNMEMQEYSVKDRVPDNFDASDFSVEPTEHSEHEGKEVVIWKLDKIEKDKSTEIRYKIKATDPEKARASGAQFSM